MLGPTLAGERLTLSPPTEEDLPLFCRWFADREITRYLLTQFPPSPQQEQDWFQRIASNQTDVVWVLRVDGQTIGSTGVHGIDWINRHATTGTMIGEREQWGKGYGTESVRLRTAFAFDDLGLERLETEVFSQNIGMHRALERSGYRKIGTRQHYIYRGGCWHDVSLLELLRDEWHTRMEET